jgi:hypothetical protein
MPIELNIVDRLITPDLAISSARNTPNLVGNIGEVMRAVHTVSLTWYSSTDQGYKITQYFLGGTGPSLKMRYERSAGSFKDDGFQVGQRIDIYYNWQNRFEILPFSSERIIADIDFISEDGSYLEVSNISSPVGFGFANTSERDNIGFWADARLAQNLHDAAVFKYGLVDNESEFSAQSNQTGAEQVYYQPLITNAIIDFREFIAQGTNKDWLTGLSRAAGVNNIARGGIYLLGSASFKNTQHYQIGHYFVLTPVYLLGQLSNLENSIVPNYLAGDNSFKYVFQVAFRTSITNVDSTKLGTFESTKGSVGWYNQNYNGYNNNYSIASIEYTDLATGSELDGIAINGTTEIVITVNRTTAFTGQNIGLYIFRLPNTQDEFEQTPTNFQSNFLYDYIRLSSAGSSGTERFLFQSISATVNGSGQLVITATISYQDFPAQRLRLANTDRYLLSLQVDDISQDIADSDKVMLIADVGTYEKGAFIDGLINWTKLDLYNVAEQSLLEPELSIDCFNRSGILLDFEFYLDRNKLSVLTGLKFSLVASNGTSFFILDNFTVSLASVIVSGGIQQINISESRGYILPSSDPFNDVFIEPTANVGGLQYYRGRFGQKIKWQEWLLNNAVDTIFYDATKPNNNLNFKSSNYSGKEGYSVFILCESTQTGVNEDSIAGDGFDQTFTGEIDVNDYTEPYGNFLNGEIKFLDPDTEVEIPAIYTNKNTLIEARAEASALVALPQYWGAIRVQQTESTGDDMEELTTDKGVRNLLKPISGSTFLNISTDGSFVVLRCLLDSSRINNSVGYDFNFELIQLPLVTGDFILTAEGDYVRTSDNNFVLSSEG